MTYFFPLDLDFNDTATPLDVLKAAQQELVERSGGVLTLLIQEEESTDGFPMLILRGKHVPSGRTTNLMSVVHRASAHYPVRIQPRDDELPNYFQKEYYRGGLADAVPALAVGRTVRNQWVCDTPAEFRRKLQQAFELGAVKSELVSLASRGTDAAVGDHAAEEGGTVGEKA